ncbi:MAG TPA: sugar transferase [Bacteroidales bacterium]|nr:sugar transferase [Bacteroidales bacterium]
MNRSMQRIKYLFFDFIAAALSYYLLYMFRKKYIEPETFGYNIPIELSQQFLLGMMLIPFFWLLLHLLSGYYRNPLRKSRLHELGQTFFTTLIGVVILFFAVLLDDWVASYKHYYSIFLTYLGLQFVTTYLPRLFITSITNHRIHTRKLGFNTLMVGSNRKALALFNEVENQEVSSGFQFVGFVNVDDKEKLLLTKHLAHLGSVKDIRQVIADHKIEEVVIALESREHCTIKNIINQLVGLKVEVKVLPDMYDILIGKVRMTAILGVPLVQIHHNLMPVWQQHAKRLIDVFFSCIALIILSPLYLFISIGVKLSSPGPVFYSHERIGRKGKPFTIYKFRSMVQDAEINGPKLSNKSDNRVTNFGRFMRKTRLDELPQFFNVLKGDMSLVGPRPERQFFIDQIVLIAPHYRHLLNVRPGITSWGQVKYGYAENVNQMVERLKYDIIYIENMSLFVDFKIMIYTVKIIFQGKGI